jgi:anti-sigma B factor antagonist
MRITINLSEEGHATVTVKGEITVKDYRQLTESVEMLANQDPVPSRVVLDLADVSYIDSVGMGCFIRIFTILKKKGAQLALVNATSPVRASLSLTKLDQIIPLE